MIQPRRGEKVNVLPYGSAQVEKILDQGRLLVTVDRMVKHDDGSITNQVIVELHPVWIARATMSAKEKE
jgi:hypothetical protein